MQEFSPEMKEKLNKDFLTRRWLENAEKLSVHRKITVINNFRYNAKYRNLTCYFDSHLEEFDLDKGDMVLFPYDPARHGVFFEKISPVKKKTFRFKKVSLNFKDTSPSNGRGNKQKTV